MALNQYDAGTTIYTTAIAMSISAGAIPPRNPLFTMAVRIVTAAMGTLFSSPSDIDDAGESWKTELAALLDAVKEGLEKADSMVSEEGWKNMGKPQYLEVVKQFFDEIDKTKLLTGNVGAALKGLAVLSMMAAGVCVVGAGILLSLAAASVASSFLPILKAALEAMKLAAAKIFSKALGSIVKKNIMAMGIIASVIAMVSSFFTSLIGDKLGKAASPTTAGSAPAFEQVIIKGLPTASTSSYTSGLGGLSGATGF